MLTSILDYSQTAMTTREEAHALACDFAESIGQNLKPKRKKVSREKHSIILINLGFKGKKFISERAAVIAAVACLDDDSITGDVASIDAFLSFHRGKLALLNWDCVTHKAPSSAHPSASIADIKAFINKKTERDSGVKAASLEALYKVFHPNGSINGELEKCARIQFWDIALESVSANLSAHKAFLSLLSKGRTTATPIQVTLALALLRVPSRTLKLDRCEAIKIVKSARNMIFRSDSEDRAPELYKEAAKGRQQKVIAAFEIVEDFLFPEKAKAKEKDKQVYA